MCYNFSSDLSLNLHILFVSMIYNSHTATMWYGNYPPGELHNLCVIQDRVDASACPQNHYHLPSRIHKSSIKVLESSGESW
jgi:hypothetical protein